MTSMGKVEAYSKQNRLLKRLTLSTCLGMNALVLADGTAFASDSATDAASTDAGTLDTVTVNGHVTTPADALRVEAEKIPGTVAVIDNAEIERGRDSTLEDVLTLQPGIFAQSTSGTEANKITIRGSGLNTFYGGYSLGLTYLIDGIPITGAAGTQEDLLSMHAVNSTTVLYGANAFDYSATSLGGAINFVLENGYTSPGLYVRVEGGSYQYQKEQLSYGGVVGDTDYYISAQHNFRSGYQDNTAIHGNDLVLNVGHTFSPKLKTRVFVRYRREEYNNGSPLTLAQIRNDPTANDYVWTRWKPGTTLVGSTTTYAFDDNSRLELNVGVDNFPLNHGIPDSFYQWYQSTDLSTSLRYLRSDELFGHASNTTVSLSNVQLVRSWMQQRIPTTTNPNIYDQNVKNTGSRTTVLSLGNDTEVIDSGWATTGISVSDVVRNIRIAYNAYPNTSGFPSDVDYKSVSIAPRVGFRYDFTPNFQAFINGSRSIDPPVTWEYIGGSDLNAFLVPLKSETATSAEVGIRGHGAIFEGSLTLYRSWIYNELLTTVLVPATATNQAITSTTNATPTIHQGIEAGLVAKLWTDDAGQKVSFRQAFTVNDFYYSHDSTFGDNQLPGIPRWVYQGALQYDHPSGFYAQASVRSATSYYVDFANTWKAPSYTTTGAKIGYDAPQKRWSVFLEGKNLTNRRYVTATNTSYNLHGATDGSVTPNFYVGDGRSLYAGFSIRY